MRTGLTIYFNRDRTFHDANKSQVWDVFKQPWGAFGTTGSDTVANFYDF